MGKSRPPKVHRSSMHFKATAVRLSELPGVLIKSNRCSFYIGFMVNVCLIVNALRIPAVLAVLLK